MLTRAFLRLNHSPLLLLIAILLGTGVVAWQAFGHFWDAARSELRLDSSVEPFIAQNSHAYQDMLRAQAAFGRDEVLVVAVERRIPVTPQDHLLKVVAVMVTMTV